LELTLDVSAAVYQLNSSVSVYRTPLYHPERCCQSVILK